MVAPSGPNLAEMDKMPAYLRAVTSAELAVLDSGALVLFWHKLTGTHLTRLSGLALLQSLVTSPEFVEHQNDQFWVMPTEEAKVRNVEYLKTLGIHIQEDQCYVAPYYERGDIHDADLLERINEKQPKYVVINLAGGKQEVLGAWLRSHCQGQPAFICTGAAIGFMTGEQANIPGWADRYYLGWLMRILRNPSGYLSRYWEARRLWPLVRKYRESTPQLAAG